MQVWLHGAELMASVIVTMKIMPSSPDVDYDAITAAAVEKVDAYTGKDADKKTELEPIAFGLKAVKVTFVMDEDKGSTDALETSLGEIEGVQSVETADVRRALG